MRFKHLTILLAAALALTLAGCAVGQRREQIEQMLQFENADRNADGVVDRSEWEAVKAQLRSAKRF